MAYRRRYTSRSRYGRSRYGRFSGFRSRYRSRFGRSRSRSYLFGRRY